jgi:hypothetical protein
MNDLAVKLWPRVIREIDDLAKRPAVWGRQYGQLVGPVTHALVRRRPAHTDPHLSVTEDRQQQPGASYRRQSTTLNAADARKTGCHSLFISSLWQFLQQGLSDCSCPTLYVLRGGADLDREKESAGSGKKYSVEQASVLGDLWQ